jgi:hypothetical protein
MTMDARHTLLVGLVAGYALGCGGSTSGQAPDAATPDAASPDSTSPDGAIQDAPADAPTSDGPASLDGGCIVPTVGAPCAPGQMACQPSNPCCAGYLWTCTNGTWAQSGLGCACLGSFACGNLTCNATQYCTDTPPGVPFDGPISDAYQCVPIPSACVATPTCSCIQGTIPSNTSCSTVGNPGVRCAEDDAGYVTIHCMGA